jgi:hypothetical protein
MKKLLIVLTFLLAFSVAYAACDFPYKEGVDSCNPLKGLTDGQVVWYGASWSSGAYSSTCYGDGVIEFVIPKYSYVAVQLESSINVSQPVYINGNYLTSFTVYSGKGLYIINLASCISTTCRVTLACVGYAGGGVTARAVYLLDDKMADRMFQNAYFNYLNFREDNDPYLVSGFSGMVTNVSKSYGNGVATYSAIATSYPFTGSFSLRARFPEKPDSIFFFNPGDIYSGYTYAIRIGTQAWYEEFDAFYTNSTNPVNLRLQKYINYSLVKDTIIPGNLRKMNVFWIDRGHNLAGIGDATILSANIMYIFPYIRIDPDFFPSYIYGYDITIFGFNSMGTYYQTYLFKYDVPRLSIDIYMPEQFYDVKATTYSFTSVSYTVKYIGEKISSTNATLYSFEVKGPLNLDARKVVVYSPQQGTLANGSIVNGVALLDKAVTMNPLYDYYVLVEWNTNTYPVFDSNDYNDNTAFVYCSGLGSCTSTSYDFPIKVNTYLPTNVYFQIRGRILGGVSPFHVCANGSIGTSPFSYCYDYTERDFVLLGLQPANPTTLTIKANVTDNTGTYAESDAFTINFFTPVLALTDVVVNYATRDYHYNQYIEINTTSEELLRGKQFVFWVRSISGGNPPYYSTLICSGRRVTKEVPGTITLGVEAPGDLNFTYEDFNGIAVDNPICENATHYCRFVQCVFQTTSGAYALNGPTVNFYIFVPKVPITPISVSLNLDKNTISVNEKVTATVSIYGGNPPYKIKLYELIYRYDICQWVGYNSTSLDLYFSFPCAYTSCQRTYYLVASVTDSLGAGATSSVVQLLVNATYNTTLPETIYCPNCPGTVGSNVTVGVPGIYVPPVVSPIISPTESLFKLTDIAMQLNITGAGLVGIMIIDRILTLAGIATLISIGIGAALGYITKNGFVVAVGILLLVIFFTLIGFYPWWFGIVFIIIAGLIVTLMFKGAF